MAINQSISGQDQVMMQAFNGRKAAPETSTTPANAVGILDLSLNSLNIKDREARTDSLPDTKTKPRAIHSYGSPAL